MKIARNRHGPNLDKCIGCHTCSVHTQERLDTREGLEYAWFNNVETKPGIGYSEGMGELRNGGTAAGCARAAARSKPRQGSKLSILMKIFANPQPAADRRLLRAVHVRLRAPADRPE